MDGFRFFRNLASFLLVFSCLSANAQTVEVTLHFDNNGTQSGCSVSLANQGSTLEGIDVQVTATVDRPSRMITDVSVADCDNGSFGSAQSIDSGIALGLNNGTNGSDVVEVAVPSNMLWHAPQKLFFYGSAENLRTSSQDLAGVDGSNGTPEGTPFYIYQAIPVLGISGLIITGALLLLVGLLVLRKRRYLLAVSLLSLAGICFAANFVADGAVGDWGNMTADIPDAADDSIPLDRTADIRAVFLALEGNSFFARVDITDLENVAPEANNTSDTVLEDGSVSITLSGSDVDGDSLTFAIATPPANGTLGAVTPIDSTSASVVYTPNADFNGADSFTFTANDSLVDSPEATADITITAVNDAPSFVTGADESVLEDAGAQSTAAWATDIAAGPADEAGQTISFTVTNDNNALFAVQPAVNSTGDLSYTPADDANGAATVTIYAMDDGGTANGGIDTSASQTFTITVSPVNDEPVFTKGADETVLEDTGAQNVTAWATDIAAGPADEAGQTVSFNVSNDNNALFAVQPAVNSAGDLSYTPADDANGSATVTVEAMDDGGTADGGDDTSDAQTFIITVTAVNDAPAFTKGADESVLEDAGAQSIAAWATDIAAGPADEAGQTVSFNVSNDNNALFAVQPAVNSAGDLSYTPADDANGSAIVTIDAMDDGGTADGGIDTSAPQTFTITVTAVNDAPQVLSGPDITINEDAAPQNLPAFVQIGPPGPADESAQIISLDVSNNNNGLFLAQPAVNAAGDLSYTLAPDANGIATVTIVAMDDGGTANGGVDTSLPAVFTISVLSVNDAPSFIKGADQSVDQDAGPQTVALWATAISAGPADEAAQLVSFVMGNDNTALFSAQPAVDGTGTLTYTPATGAFGTALVTIAAMDDGGTANGGVDTSAPQTFFITVVAANTAPVLDPIGSTSIDELSTLSFTATASDSDLPAQTLTFSLAGAPAGASITPAGAFTWTPTELQGSPAPGSMYTFDVVVTDDGLPIMSDFETITITVNEVNQNPQSVDAAFDSTGNVGIAVAAVNGLLIGATDDDLPQQTLSLTAETVASLNGGEATISTDGSFTYSPPVGYTGSDTFSFTVNDDQGGTDTGQVTVTVAGMIWFIDSSATAGNGTLAEPFNSLAAMEAVNGSGLAGDPAVNQCIFLDVGTGADYAGPLTLQNGQMLVGSGAAGAITTECGITPVAFSATLPLTGGARPGIASTANGINLAAENMLTGLNIRTTAGFGILGASVGTLNVDLVSILDGGPALGITNGALGTVIFDTLECTSSGATPCINLTGVFGTLGVISGGNGLSHSGGSANLNITGGNVNLDYPGNITKTAGFGSGVFMDGNAGVLTLSGVLNISTGAVDAFVARNGGTINVTGSNNTVAANSGNGVEINATTIGSGGVSFGSISVNGAVNGIKLLNTGIAGAFIVTGDGSIARNGSGGTIQNTTGDGVVLNNVSSVTLQSMNLFDVGDSTDPNNGGNTLATNDHAIQSEGGADITLSAVHIQNPIGSGWEAVNLGGTNRIDNNSLIEGIDSPNMQALEVRNTDVNMTLFTIDGAEISDQAATNGGSYVQFNGFGNSVMAVTIANTVFEDIFGQAVQVSSGEGLAADGTITTNITNSIFRDAVLGTVGLAASGGIGGVVISARNNATHNYSITGNTFTDLGRPLANGGLINIQGVAGTGKSLDGLISNNTIDRVGFYLATGDETGGGHRVIDMITENNIIFLDGEITDNDIDKTGREAMYIASRDDSVDFDVRIQNNRLGQITPIGLTDREAIEILSENFSDMEILVDSNLINGNTNFMDYVVDVDVENTSVMDMTFTNNTVTNLNVAPDKGDEIVFDTEGGASNLCLDFKANTALLAEFDVDGTFTMDWGGRVANNPGVVVFTDGVGITDVAGLLCAQPTF